MDELDERLNDTMSDEGCPNPPVRRDGKDGQEC